MSMEKREPYRGYYFRILTSQGPDARAAERTQLYRQRLHDRRIRFSGFPGGIRGSPAFRPSLWIMMGSSIRNVTWALKR